MFKANKIEKVLFKKKIAIVHKENFIILQEKKIVSVAIRGFKIMENKEIEIVVRNALKF